MATKVMNALLAQFVDPALNARKIDLDDRDGKTFKKPAISYLGQSATTRTRHVTDHCSGCRQGKNRNTDTIRIRKGETGVTDPGETQQRAANTEERQTPDAALAGPCETRRDQREHVKRRKLDIRRGEQIGDSDADDDRQSR